MPNPLLRTRQPPEVHAAAETLKSRGVDVGRLIGRTLIDAAAEESGLVAWADKNGLRVRKTAFPDQDGFVVHVVTNGAGKPPEEGARVVCSFTFAPLRRLWYAAATRVVRGDERIDCRGVEVPAGLPVDRWVTFAEGRA